MSKAKSILKLLLILLVGILMFSNISAVYAAYNDGDSTTYMPDEFTKTKVGKELKEGGEISVNSAGTLNIKSTGGKIVGLIRIVGTIMSIAMIMILGIKYMMGSAEERATYKKALLPYFVGAILIFGASNLAQIVYSWASKI